MQDAIVVSHTLIIRVLRCEGSRVFVGTAASLTCFGNLLRYVEDSRGFVGSIRRCLLLPGVVKAEVKRNVT